MKRTVINKYPSGRTETFDCDRFIPLGCSDFITAHNEKTSLYEIRMDALNIKVSDPGEESIYLEKGPVTMPISFRSCLPIYALVDGGWLPPPFVDPPVYLFDRNVIGHIQQISKGNVRDIYADIKWWLELIDDDEAHISPFLYAFESNRQAVPTIDEFKISYVEATKIIRGLFPKAKIRDFGEGEYDAAFQTSEDVLRFHAEETEFLQRVAPLIRENVSQNNLEEVCQNILEIATEIGLSFRSLPLLATLSCLYEDRNASGFNVARELLKLRGGHYTREKAYNVLSDMRGLLFYLMFCAIADQMEVPRAAYCTADKAAILFGCGLNFTNIEFRGNQLFMTTELNEFLFPRMPKDKRFELVSRFEEG